MYQGSCACGAVRFEVDGELRPPDACHCQQCRKQSGHFWVSTDVSKAALTIHGEEALTWFRSSERVRRGFCSRCGAFLFWDPLPRDKIAVAMGAFDTPTGLSIHEHIFVSEKGDYYRLDDGIPQRER